MKAHTYPGRLWRNAQQATVRERIATTAACAAPNLGSPGLKTGAKKKGPPVGGPFRHWLR